MNRKGIDLQQKKDVLCLHPKGEGKPTMIIKAAKKHVEQDYFTNKFQSYDKNVQRKNAEELCSFQGKITSVFEDEMDPNFKATPSSSSMSEEEINRNVKGLSEFKLKPPNLSLSEMLNLLPPDDSNLEVIEPRTKNQKTMIISAAKRHVERDYFTNKFQSYDKNVHCKNAEELCSFQGKITSVFEDELDPNFKATPSSSSMSEEKINRNVKDLSEYKLKPPNLSLSEMLNLLPPDDSNF